MDHLCIRISAFFSISLVTRPLCQTPNLLSHGTTTHILDVFTGYLPNIAESIIEKLANAHAKIFTQIRANAYILTVFFFFQGLIKSKSVDVYKTFIPALSHLFCPLSLTSI